MMMRFAAIDVGNGDIGEKRRLVHFIAARKCRKFLDMARTMLAMMRDGVLARHR